jgi:hypothetical protein
LVAVRWLFTFIGTALAACGLLSYEILTTRLVGVVIGGHTALLAIAFAMIGMGFATSLLSIDDKPERAWSSKSLSITVALLGLSYVTVLFALSWVTTESNALFDRAIVDGGLNALLRAMRSWTLLQVVIVGSVLSVPYVIFGIFIAVLFRSIDGARYHLVYAADLLGAAGGCVLAIVCLEYFSYRGGVGLILASTFLATACFATQRPSEVITSGLLACITVVLMVSGWLSSIEPQPSLAMLSRDYEGSRRVSEIWHLWNGQSRVGLLQFANSPAGAPNSVYAHENGDGWAVVGSGTANERLVTMYQPKRVLVIFAGVGADMLSIDENCGGSCDITGVEINRQMVDHALTTSPRLKEFLSRPNIDLQVAEGREYLERDQTQYDAILLSWWGAGTSYYVGAAGRLSQFMYTKEAIETLFDHLTPQGIVVMYNGSKAEMLATLRDVYADRADGELQNDVVIVQPSRRAGRGPQFFDTLEEMRMIIKPSGFSEGEITTLEVVAEQIDSGIILSPRHVDEHYTVYRDLQGQAPLETINAKLASLGIALEPVTDDRPFLNDLTPRGFFLDPGKWAVGTRNPAWQNTRSLAGGVVVLVVIAIVLAVGPLLLSSGPALTLRSIVHLAYFWVLGSGFMLIETGYVSKLGLVLGHPSYAIAIVLAALIFSTGIGSLASKAVGARLSQKTIAALIVVTAIVGTLVYDASWKTVIGLDVVTKSMTVVVFLFPLGFLLGQLFPTALAVAGRDDPRLVPWAWAVNSIASTTAVGLAFIFSIPFGFNAMIYIGAAFYALLLLLPSRRLVTA